MDTAAQHAVNGFTDCQPVPCEISRERAAADIEPFVSMASSSAIFAGSSMAPFAKALRMRRRGECHEYQQESL
jgi:hypothetical protein